MTLESTPKNATPWSTGSMVLVGLVQTGGLKIWRAFGMCPTASRFGSGPQPIEGVRDVGREPNASERA
jgi:hypothetical protein